MGDVRTSPQRPALALEYLALMLRKRRRMHDVRAVVPHQRLRLSASGHAIRPSGQGTPAISMAVCRDRHGDGVGCEGFR